MKTLIKHVIGMSQTIYMLVLKCSLLTYFVRLLNNAILLIEDKSDFIALYQQ